MSDPCSIRTFFPDGLADGMRIIEKGGWHGKMFICPRDLIENHFDRSGLKDPGIYILIGQNRIYIGEAINVSERMLAHLHSKDFWGRAIIFTSRQFNKALAKYLESKLIDLAIETKACEIEQNRMALPQLSEADICDAEIMLREIKFLLKAHDFYYFEKPRMDPIVKPEPPKVEQPPEYRPPMKNVTEHTTVSVIPDKTRTEFTKPALSNTRSPAVNAVIPAERGTKMGPRFGNT